MIVKTLVKSSLDNYVLPGTLTGTEILFVYVQQWKRDVFIFTLAVLHFISSQLDRSQREEPMMEACRDEHDNPQA